MFPRSPTIFKMGTYLMQFFNAVIILPWLQIKRWSNSTSRTETFKDYLLEEFQGHRRSDYSGHTDEALKICVPLCIPRVCKQTLCARVLLKSKTETFNVEPEPGSYFSETQWEQFCFNKTTLSVIRLDEYRSVECSRVGTSVGILLIPLSLVG